MTPAAAATMTTRRSLSYLTVSAQCTLYHTHSSQSHRSVYFIFSFSAFSINPLTRFWGICMSTRWFGNAAICFCFSRSARDDAQQANGVSCSWLVWDAHVGLIDGERPTFNPVKSLYKITRAPMPHRVASVAAIWTSRVQPLCALGVPNSRTAWICCNKRSKLNWIQRNFFRAKFSTFPKIPRSSPNRPIS